MWVRFLATRWQRRQRGRRLRRRSTWTWSLVLFLAYSPHRHDCVKSSCAFFGIAKQPKTVVRSRFLGKDTTDAYLIFYHRPTGASTNAQSFARRDAHFMLLRSTSHMIGFLLFWALAAFRLYFYPCFPHPLAWSLNFSS